MCLYLCLFLCFVPVFIWEPAVDTNNPNSKPISHSYVLPAYIVIIVTYFSRNEKPGFLILSILPYLISPLYAAVFPNSHHALTRVNALLPLTGLWHPALGSLSPSHGGSPLAAGALAFWAESLPCRDPFLLWSSAIPHGLPWLSPHSPTGTPTLRSLDLMGLGLNCSRSEQLNGREKDMERGREREVHSYF